MSSATDRARLDSFLRRGKRLNRLSAIVAMMCGPSLISSAQQRMTFSTALKPTLHTSSSLTFLTRLIFRTVSVLAPTHNND